MSILFKNTFFYTIGNVLPQAVAFFLLPILTTYLSPEEYGIVSSMQVIQILLAVFFSFGLEKAVIRLYWDYKTEAEQKVFLGTAVLAVFLIALAVLGLVFIFRQLINLFFIEIAFKPYFTLTIFTTFLLAITFLPKYYYRLKHKANIFLLISMVELVLTTGLTLYFVISKNEAAEGVLKGKLFSIILLAPLFIYISVRKIRFVIDFKILKECMKFSLPAIPALFAAWSIGQIDKVFIADYLSLSEVGIYGLSKRIGGLITIISSSFMLAYHPLYFEIASNSDEQSRRKLFRYNNIFIIVIISFAFGLVLFSKELTFTFLDERYWDTYKYFPFITLSLLISSISSAIIGASFQQSKKMKQDMYFGFVGAAINIFLCYLLIEPFGLYGAIMGMFLSSLAIFALTYVYTMKYCFFVPMNWRLIGTFLLVYILIISFFHFFVHFSIVAALIIKSFVLIILIFIIFYNYRNDLKAIFQKKIDSNLTI